MLGISARLHTLQGDDLVDTRWWFPQHPWWNRYDEFSHFGPIPI